MMAEGDLALILAAAPAPLVVFDRRFRIVEATDAYLAMAGRTREELLGLDVFTAFPDNPRDPDAGGVRALRASLEHVFANGVAERMDLRRYDVQDPATGRWHERHWEPLNVPVRDAAGEVVFVIQRVEEVTDAVLRARADEQRDRVLRSSQEQLEAAQRMARLGSWEYRLQTGELTMSDGLRHLYDLGRDESVAHPEEKIDRVRAEDRAHVMAQLAAATRGEQPDDIRYHVTVQDAELVVQRRLVPVREDGVVVAVRATIQDITEHERLDAERRRLLAELEVLATTDPLTGLPNRRSWDHELDREIARARRHGDPLTLALLDLDRFKAFNDTHGHAAGDALLTDAAAAWRAVLRETDVLARFGGDEFALALPECGEERATEALERLAAATPAGQSVSVGLATWVPGEDAEALCARADGALYAAKQAGRGRIRASPRAGS